MQQSVLTQPIDVFQSAACVKWQSRGWLISSQDFTDIMTRSGVSVCERDCERLHAFSVTVSVNYNQSILLLIGRFKQFPAERCHGSNPEDRGGFTETQQWVRCQHCPTNHPHCFWQPATHSDCITTHHIYLDLRVLSVIIVVIIRQGQWCNLQFWASSRVPWFIEQSSG